MSPLKKIDNEFVITSSAVSACLIRCTLMVSEMGDRWPCDYCFVNDYTQYSCVVPIELFFLYFVGNHIADPLYSMDTSTAWKKRRFILSDTSNLLMTDNL